MDGDKVLETAKKLVYFIQDAEYISKAFMSYYANTQYDERFSLGINLVKFMNSYNRAISCSLPFDVLHVLLYDETLLPLGERNVNMKETRRLVVNSENTTIEKFREIMIGNSGISDVRDGISENLTLERIKERRNLINNYVVLPLQDAWIKFFRDMFSNKGEKWVSDTIKDFVGNIFLGKTQLHTIIPLPSYTYYVGKILQNFAKGNNGNSIIRVESVKDEDSITPYKVEDLSRRVMEAIRTHISSIIREIEVKDLNSQHFKVATVIHTLVDEIVQSNSHIYDYGPGEKRKSKSKIDWGYLIESPKELQTLNKSLHNQDETHKILSPLRKKVERIEQDALLILLKDTFSNYMNEKVFSVDTLIRLYNKHEEDLINKTNNNTVPFKFNNVIEKYTYENITKNTEFYDYISKLFGEKVYREILLKAFARLLYKKYIKSFIGAKCEEIAKSGDALASTIHRVDMNFIAPGSDTE